MSGHLFRVTYRVKGEDAGPTGTVSRWAPKRNEDGSFTTDVDLSYARKQGTYEDIEATQRIVAIAHVAGRITHEQVVIVAATPFTDRSTNV